MAKFHASLDFVNGEADIHNEDYVKIDTIDCHDIIYEASQKMKARVKEYAKNQLKQEIDFEA